MTVDSTALPISESSGNGKPVRSVRPFVIMASACALSTSIVCIAINEYLVHNIGNLGGSDAGNALVGGLILRITRYAAIPLGIINALIVSPLIAWPLTAKSWILSPILWNTLAVLVVIGAIMFGMTSGYGFYLIFIVPYWALPMVVGSLVYSYCKLLMVRKYNKGVERTG